MSDPNNQLNFIRPANADGEWPRNMGGEFFDEQPKPTTPLNPRAP